MALKILNSQHLDPPRNRLFYGVVDLLHVLAILRLFLNVVICLVLPHFCNLHRSMCDSRPGRWMARETSTGASCSRSTIFQPNRSSSFARRSISGVWTRRNTACLPYWPSRSGTTTSSPPTTSSVSPQHGEDYYLYYSFI